MRLPRTDQSIKRFRRLVNALFGVMIASSGFVTGVAATEPAPQEVQVVVTASRIPQELDTAPVWVDVVSEEEIKETGARTVNEVLQQVPGVNTKTNGTVGSAASISVRGSTSEQVLILVDGRRVNSPMSGSLDLNQIPLAMIERIEVLQGSASALYGADAMAGVINIITKSGGSSQHQLSAEFGEYGTQTLQGTIQGGEGSLKYFVSGERITSDGYRPNSDYTTTKLFARLDNQWSPHDLTQLSITHYSGELGVPGSITWPSETARQADSQTRADFTYERTISANSDLALRAYADNGSMNYDSGYAKSAHDMTVLGVEAQMNQPASGNRMLLSYGGNVESATADSTDLGITRQRNSASAFGHSQYQVNPQTDASIGIRYDWYSTHGGALSSRAGVAFRPRPNARIYAYVGSSFRAPTFNELYWDDPWSKGNPHLLPETAWNYEAGINSGLGRNVNLSVACFIRDTTNLIGWRPQNPSDPNSIWEVANTASAIVEGIEATWSQQLTSQLAWQLSYTLLDARDQNGDKLGLIAPQQGSLSVTYQDQGFSAKLETVAKQDAPLLPGYTVSHLTLQQALHSGVDLTLRVRNLLDAEYAEQVGYPASPRNVTVGMRINF